MPNETNSPASDNQKPKPNIKPPEIPDQSPNNRQEDSTPPVPPKPKTNTPSEKSTTPPPATNQPAQPVTPSPANQPPQPTTPKPTKKPPQQTSSVSQIIQEMKSKPLTTNPTPSSTPPPSEPISIPKSTDTTKSPLMTLLTNRLFLIGSGIAIAVIIALILGYYYFIYNIGTLTLNFNTTPDSLQINQQNYSVETSLEQTFSPGTYTLIATKTNYFTEERTFTISPQETTNLNIDLIAYPTPTEVVEYTTNFPFINPAETEISYLSNFGTTFYKVNLEKYTKDIISPQTFNNIDDIFWAPAARQACIIQARNNPRTTDFQDENILYKDNRTLDSTIFHFYDFSKYDFVSQDIITYPDTILNPNWHPTKEEIIFHYVDSTTGENTLSKSKPNLENKEVITDLNMNNALVKYSPDTEIIAILDTDLSATAEPNPIYLFHTVSRNFEKVPTKDRFSNFLWSPDSSTILGILENNNLALIDPKTLNTTNLPTEINADIAHINWFPNSQKLIIAEEISASADNLLIYDIATNNISAVITDNSLIFNNISYPIMTSDGQLTYFIGDGHLYSLNIYTQ